jgi:hypothetical protein
MNSDAIKSLLVKAALVAGTHLATRYHISGDQVTAITADVGTAAAAIYAIYDHWGMKKVPATATVAA